MDRRTFLLGFLGSLAAAPTIVAAASSVEAAPVSEVQPLILRRLPSRHRRRLKRRSIWRRWRRTGASTRIVVDGGSIAGLTAEVRGGCTGEVIGERIDGATTTRGTIVGGHGGFIGGPTGEPIAAGTTKKHCSPAICARYGRMR